MTKKITRRVLKSLLADAFRAPSPGRKEAFLSTLPRQRISNSRFLLTQAGYIPLWVWGICALPFPVLLLNTCLMAKSNLWILSALTPFIAMSAVTENARSCLCRMAELEMASRFSLKSVAFARLGIIGTAHLLLLLILAPLCGQGSARSLMQNGIYLLVPYLTTSFLSLLCCRRIHARESLYTCMGIAVMVSSLCIFLQERLPFFYQEEYRSWWIRALLLLLILSLMEYYKTIRQQEDLIWNLS